VTRRWREEDTGFTLVELLVAATILPLLLGIVGALVISAMRTDAAVRDETQAASTGQASATAITKATRQADWVSVTSSAAGQLLRVRTASSTTALTWSCRAWWYSAGKLWQRSATSTIALPSAPATQGWTLLVDGVSQQGTTPAFIYADGVLTVTYTVATGAHKPLLVTTMVSPRQAATAGSTLCQ
jgi:prepilin-type N-terminal cleavage/methylation domain-containing protein